MPSQDLVPPDAEPVNTFYPTPQTPSQDGQVVPNVVHYVYGLKPTKGQLAKWQEQESRHKYTTAEFLDLGDATTTEVDFPYYAYLSIRSALIHLKPDQVYFHYYNLPTGPWWDEIKTELTLVKAHVPERVYGNVVDHYAHQSDVGRVNDSRAGMEADGMVCS